MPYHPYIPDHEYKRDDVVAFLEDHIQSEAIENKYAAEQWLNDIRSCPHLLARHHLTGVRGKQTTGEPICDDHVVNTTPPE